MLRILYQIGVSIAAEGLGPFNGRGAGVKGWGKGGGGSSWLICSKSVTGWSCNKPALITTWPRNGRVAENRLMAGRGAVSPVVGQSEHIGWQ